VCVQTSTAFMKLFGAAEVASALGIHAISKQISNAIFYRMRTVHMYEYVIKPVHLNNQINRPQGRVPHPF
jgi:hypothetical protein